VQYFSTANDLDGSDLVWTIGSGEFLPGLEEGMMGMKSKDHFMYRCYALHLTCDV
jgi:FKBP-type peptidyl-prolyl cis-trans isomerase (trigger factor)